LPPSTRHGDGAGTQSHVVDKYSPSPSSQAPSEHSVRESKLTESYTSRHMSATTEV